MQEKSAPHFPAPSPPKRPAAGTDAANVLHAVEMWPGLPTLHVIERVHSQWPSIPDGSIRVALTRLNQKRLIVSRENKWFPA